LSPWVTLLVSAAIAISYLDRKALPVAVAATQRDIPLTNTLPADSMGGFRFHGWVVVVEIFTDAGHVGIGNAAL
jgi:hypothetical protein